MHLTHKDIDVLFVSPGNNKVIYQGLAKQYSAIEPPIWAGLLAKHTRNQGYGVDLVDQEAQGLESEEIVEMANNHGVETWFLRPRELATDQSAKYPVIKHALLESEKYFPGKIPKSTK